MFLFIQLIEDLHVVLNGSMMLNGFWCWLVSEYEMQLQPEPTCSIEDNIKMDLEGRG
jgi:hypothetical protein